MNLSKNNIKLRALEPEDLDFLFEVENKEEIWHISGTQVPFSRYILKQYIANSHIDIYEAKQLRLVIEYKNKPIGFIDLFDFNPLHKRAGIGIVIIKSQQNNGFATTALKILIKYAFSILNLHQLYANIESNNITSKKLFTNVGFELVGVKKEWNFTPLGYRDEELYQLINKNTLEH
ncbi:MAG TPA: N-acetyltransferase [Flavobacteriia bacterium]|jgi:diamine N-acetyltransferase|nr:N-acetyltransferase [Flavobacteriia bacterium]